MPVGVQCLMIPISSSLGEFPSYWVWLWCRPTSLHLPYLVFSIRSYLPLDFNRVSSLRNRNRNRNLKTSKALLKSQAHQGTSLFTSAATNQRGVSKGGSREAQ